MTKEAVNKGVSTLLSILNRAEIQNLKLLLDVRKCQAAATSESCCSTESVSTFQEVAGIPQKWRMNPRMAFLLATARHSNCYSSAACVSSPAASSSLVCFMLYHENCTSTSDLKFIQSIAPLPLNLFKVVSQHIQQASITDPLGMSFYSKGDFYTQAHANF